MVRNMPANAGDVRDVGSIPGLGRFPGGGTATHSSILAWRIPWTEEPGRLQSMGSQSWTRLSAHTQLLNSEESICSAGDTFLLPRSARSPGGGNDNPLQFP